MHEAITVNIVLDKITKEKIELYSRYLGISFTATTKYMIAKQMKTFFFHKEKFESHWKKRRYRRKDTDFSETLKRYSLKVPYQFHQQLQEIAGELDIKVPGLLINMVRSELEQIFKDYEKNLAIPAEKIEKIKISKISTSNIFKKDLQVIAQQIGISENVLISNIIAEYLCQYYSEFDCDTYVNEEEEEKKRKDSNMW